MTQYVPEPEPEDAGTTAEKEQDESVDLREPSDEAKSTARYVEEPEPEDEQTTARGQARGSAQ